MTNVVRHADAKHCEVTLRRGGERLWLGVADDGRGFDEKALRGVGLASMRERAEEIGGAFEISSVVGGSGTRVVAGLPLRSA
jgi:signal transduction histidine kinase